MSELCERGTCKAVATHQALSLTDGEVMLCSAHATSLADRKLYISGSIQALQGKRGQ